MLATWVSILKYLSGPSKLAGIGFPSGYRLCRAGCCGARPASIPAGAGDADASALVQRVAESVGLTGFELGEPVQALGGGVGDPGDHRCDDLVLPAGYGPGQRDEFRDVVVLGAPVIVEEQPAADVTLTGMDPVTRARRFRASRSFSLGSGRRRSPARTGHGPGCP
jgi:hypothetical protein